ncbi:lectin [Leptospira sp. 201903071]|uniref:lectin n=1 Tax=Leptospira ainazelensis TaxID=2810034 RepID=UPI0019668ED5|nr:lectin [Leptospira ainazelensis]MBM9501472.1 lectin [Leptospira ainazelensis]
MKRILSILIFSLFLGTMGNLYASRGAVVENPIDVFERSFENKVLSIQRKTQVNANLPVHRALFYGTHNSYNSKSYAGPFFSYAFPNQKYSIGDQLRLGARFIELDVHWALGARARKELLLCHGQDNHVGCNVFDRPFHKGLEEVRNWVSNSSNRNEVIVLYIEDKFDGHSSEALQTLKDYLDPWLYRYSGSCSDVPSPENMPKLGDMVASNKRILLMSNGCYDSQWSGYFKKIFFGGATGSPKEFKGYPNCNYSRATYNSTMVRFFNDTTNYFGFYDGVKESGSFTDSAIQSMLACEVNVFGIDQFDSDFAKKAIWSWNTSEPNNWAGNEHCAVVWSNGRWNDLNCASWNRFSCKDSSGNWYVTSGGGSWSSGNSQCSSETAGRYKFSAPLTPYENRKLLEAKNSSGAGDLWINLTDQTSEGSWLLGN